MYRVKTNNSSFVISQKEMEIFRQMNESSLQKQFNSLESSELLSLSNLLDSMACDDETIQAILVMVVNVCCVWMDNVLLQSKTLNCVE